MKFSRIRSQRVESRRIIIFDGFIRLKGVFDPAINAGRTFMRCRKIDIAVKIEPEAVRNA